MYNYQYFFDIYEWSSDAKSYLDNICSKYDLEYFIEKNFLNEKEIAINFRGQKDDLDEFEFKFIKEFSDILKVEDFTKTSTHITPLILKDNSDFDVNSCSFNLYAKKKRVISLDVKSELIKLLKSSKVGLIRNINGYYLIAIATKSKPVKMIRELLNLPTKTLPLLIKNTILAKYANISKKESELLNSDIRPIVRVKKKQLHRLEKVKNAPVGAVTFNNFYDLKLPKNSLEELLVYEVGQPLIFYKISDIDKIIDDIEFLVNAPKSFIDYPDSFMQKVYGKDMVLSVGFGLAPLSIKLPKKIEKECFSTYKDSIAIAKNDEILCSCNIKKMDFFNINNFKSNCQVELEEKSYVSTLHRYLSGFEEAIVFEFLSDSAKILEYKGGDFSILYEFEKSISKLFDDTFGKDVSYKNEAQLLAESKYEICHEDIYEYEKTDKIIKISIDKDIPANLRGSAIINTITKIVTDTIEEQDTNIILCGEIFENKNLTENIIEYMDDHDITYFISDKVPLNSSVNSMGALLDFYINK